MYSSNFVSKYISTSCFTLSCISTEIQCQALYIVIAIDELITAMNTAEYHLNLTSSLLVGIYSPIPSVSTITTQWLIFQASAVDYQTSTMSGPLINSVNSRVLSTALNATSLFIFKFLSSYMDLVSSVRIGNYNQSFDDFTNSIMLNAALNKFYSPKFDVNLGPPIFYDISVGSSINGILVTSFIRSASLAAFDALSTFQASYVPNLKSYVLKFNNLSISHYGNMGVLTFNTRNEIIAQTKHLIQTMNESQVYNNAGKCYITIYESFYNDSVINMYARDIDEPLTKSAHNLFTNLKNLVRSYYLMLINCYKVGCAGNTIYPYSTWNIKCVNDFSFSSFCLSEGFPSTLKRCPSAKAQALIACLDNVTPLITSANTKMSNDLNMILEKRKNDYDALMKNHLNEINVFFLNLAKCFDSSMYNSTTLVV